MTAAKARNGDECKLNSAYNEGHSTLVASAVKTYVNGKLVVRLDDIAAFHGHTDKITGDTYYYGPGGEFPSGKITTASTVVFAERKSVARVGDTLTCGCIIIAGSSNTFTE